MAQQNKVSNFINKYAIFIVLIVMIIALSFLSPAFLTVQNLINVLITESGRGILALGVAFAIISRGIDLSVGSIVSLTSVIAASLVQEPSYSARIFPNLPLLPPIVAVLAGLAAGALVGLTNGALIAYTAIPPFIATLGSMIIARGFALILTNAYPVPMLRPEFKIIGQGSLGPIPYVVIVFVIVAIIAYIILNYTKFGKHVYAIGGNVNAARTSGIKVEKNLLGIYMVSGICASIAGILITARAASGIATLGNNYELDAIAAATIGGTSHTGGIGTVPGIIAGILILGILNNGLLLLGISPYLQQVIKGIIIVGAVVFDMRKNARQK
ncbi:MAG TPA: ABC transporter permease [Rectinema sp.]|jgi:inositol transport system permease protein|nr:sugar ABC transporter permease [Spirochaetaceae bacterium]HNV19268.1 ABC transporter permease [Rectinema sp.]HNZ93981.1 ABC transporter permease [Rectinema sp.]HOD58760.1 ABC transporter permease [Rectinema sp.]HOH17464.1 ABC transporter permease [Rectinema sp.]